MKTLLGASEAPITDWRELPVWANDLLSASLTWWQAQGQWPVCNWRDRFVGAIRLPDGGFGVTLNLSLYAPPVMVELPRKKADLLYASRR